MVAVGLRDRRLAKVGGNAGPRGGEEARAVVGEVAGGVDGELGRDALPDLLLPVRLEDGVGERGGGRALEHEPLADERARGGLQELHLRPRRQARQQRAPRQQEKQRLKKRRRINTIDTKAR